MQKTQCIWILKQNKKMIERAAYNERFCVIAAVSPQIMQWKLASYYPAGSSVEAATTQSRHHVIGNAGQCGADSEARSEKLNVRIWKIEKNVE